MLPTQFSRIYKSTPSFFPECQARYRAISVTKDSLSKRVGQRRSSKIRHAASPLVALPSNYVIAVSVRRSFAEDSATYLTDVFRKSEERQAGRGRLEIKLTGGSRVTRASRQLGTEGS
ncbi:hypothetical protein KM043_007410 [Ampulex compressa]|nr:hypothetical protein KM043_007410 [Ampulex compressa]